jgi:hypothetical protein
MKLILLATLLTLTGCQGQPTSIQWETYDLNCQDVVEPGLVPVTTVRDDEAVFSAAVRVDAEVGITGDLVMAVVAPVNVGIDLDTGDVGVFYCSSVGDDIPFQVVLGIRREP